jgi:hypothetical protein
MSTSDRGQIESVCAAFSAALAAHLIANGKGVGWPTSPCDYLVMRCEQELLELRFEVGALRCNRAVHEALDVAAFTMMLWDNLR